MHFILFQVSLIYQSMKIEVLSKMIPFFDFSVVEKIAVDAVKYKFVAMEVIHRIGVVRFGNLVSAISMYLLLQVQVKN